MTSLVSKPQHIQPTKNTQDSKDELRLSIKQLLTLSIINSINHVQEFHAYSKKELTFVFELSEYNLHASQLYLRKNPKPKVKETLIKFLSGHIEPGLTALGLSAEDLNLSSKAHVKNHEESKDDNFSPTGPNLFELKLTKELLHYILDFLDPISLGKMGFTCKMFHEISVHPLLFKKFCKKLYLQHPPLPNVTPFYALLQRINIAPLGEFTPRFIERANNDIRALVWVPDLKTYYTAPNFYKQFKCLRGVFLNAPRLRFGGVYKMKEKYIRSGSKDFNGYYDPYHTVEFYRYFRFFPDGLAMSYLSVNKLKVDKLSKVFSPNSQFLEDEADPSSLVKNVLQGEYIVQKSTVHIRLCAKTTIYQYELEIGSSAPGLFDQLKMMSQSMRSVDSDYSEPLLVHHNHTGNKRFKFVKVKALLEDLDPTYASVGL